VREELTEKEKGRGRQKQTMDSDPSASRKRTTKKDEAQRKVNVKKRGKQIGLHWMKMGRAYLGPSRRKGGENVAAGTGLKKRRDEEESVTRGPTGLSPTVARHRTRPYPGGERGGQTYRKNKNLPKVKGKSQECDEKASDDFRACAVRTPWGSA